MDKITQAKKMVKDLRGLSAWKKEGIVQIGVTYTNGDIYKSTNLSIRKRGLEKTVKEALRRRKELEDKFGEPKFTPKKSKANRKTKTNIKVLESFFILELTHKPTEEEIRLKFDLDKLDLIKDRYFYLDINEMDRGGYSVSTWDKGKQKKVKLKELLFPDKEGVINHKNRDKFDYREDNIIFKENTQYTKAPKYSQSDTAIPGVSFVKKRDKTYWKAGFQRGGQNKSKWFAISKYGYKRAKELAEGLRRKWDREYEKNQ